MKIVVTIEARMTSSRLPGKVLLPLFGKPALERMLERVGRSKHVDEIVVATTINDTDDCIVALCENLGVSYFRGSEDDVMDRVLKAASSQNADLVVGLTGDCPLVDPEHIDEMIEMFKEGSFDYVSNRLEPGIPDGFDVQVYPLKKLKEISSITSDPLDRVHVTCYFYNNPSVYRIGTKKVGEADEIYFPELEVTLDEEDDYILLNKIFEELYPYKNNFNALDVIRLMRSRPDLYQLNQHVNRKQREDG